MKLLKTILAIAIFSAAPQISAGNACGKTHHHDHAAHGHGHSGCVGNDHHGHEDEGHCAHAAAHGRKTGEHGAPKTIELGAGVAKAMGIKCVPLEKRRLRSTATFAGRLELASDARKVVPVPVAGRVALKVKELDRVKRGEVLFTVDSPAIKTLAHQIEVLKSRLEVYRRINSANAEIEAELKIKCSEREALVGGAEWNGSLIVVRAAEDAMVERLGVIDGSWAELGSAAVTTLAPERVRFVSLVCASEAAKLADGMKGEVAGVEATVRLGAGDNSGMTRVYAIFGEGVAPGRSGERKDLKCILDESEKPVAAVPEDSLVMLDAEMVVFVRSKGDAGHYSAVKAMPGRSGGGWIEVAGEGLHEGVEVVKEGVYMLKLAFEEKPQEKPVGHYHADGTFHTGEH